MRTLLVVPLLSLAVPALAQVQPARPPVTIDMDEDVIEGSLHTPDVLLRPTGPKSTHRSLIRIRQSFSQELLASALKI